MPSWLQSFIDSVKSLWSQEELESLRTRFRKYRLQVVAGLLVLVLVWFYSSNPQPFALINALLDRFPFLYLDILVLVLIGVLFIYIRRVERDISGNSAGVAHEDHVPSLRGILRHEWEYHGEWSLAEDEGITVLRVTQSSPGGIMTKCRLWRDYIFEFDAKILNKNVAWIVRAHDIFNYVMFQINEVHVRPHLCVNGVFLPIENYEHHHTISANEWFHVVTTVRGDHITIVITNSTGITKEIYSKPLLQPQVATIKFPSPSEANRTIEQQATIAFPLGSVGFRQASDELASFKNMKVSRLD